MPIVTDRILCVNIVFKNDSWNNGQQITPVGFATDEAQAKQIAATFVLQRGSTFRGAYGIWIPLVRPLTYQGKKILWICPHKVNVDTTTTLYKIKQLIDEEYHSYIEYTVLSLNMLLPEGERWLLG